MKFLLSALILTLTVHSFACMTQAKRINDDSSLAYNGVLFDGEPETSLMIEKLIKIENVSTEYSISDSSGEETHTLKILGYIRGQDKNGTAGAGDIISTSYYIKDANTGEEEIFQMKSNEIENGMRTRGMAKSILTTIGCN